MIHKSQSSYNPDLATYAQLRNTSKVLEFGGMILGGITAILTATGSFEESYNAPIILGSISGALILTGWVTDWVAISKIRDKNHNNMRAGGNIEEYKSKFEASRYDQPKYNTIGVGKGKKYYKQTHKMGGWSEVTKEEYDERR